MSIPPEGTALSPRINNSHVQKLTQNIGHTQTQNISSEIQ